MVIRFVFSLLALVLMPTALFADGLIYQLPADGSWVRFEALGNADGPDGSESTRAWTITLSSVGATEVDGEKCRWIEITTESQEDGEPSLAVEKFLIPETNLRRGKDPLERVLKSWLKTPKAVKAREISTPLQNASFFLHGPLESIRELEALEVDSKLGKLECKGIEAKEKAEEFELLMAKKYTIRLHDEAPFGVVSWKVQYTLAGLALGGKMTTELKLIDHGTNATSLIPEAK